MSDDNMIRLGYDDVNEDGEQKPKQSGQKFVKLKKEYVPPYLSPEKLAEIKEEMSCSVVHDFRDQYHMTEEEREKRFQLYKCFKAVDFKTIKFKINKLSDYVKTMRKCIKCLELVSENNGQYDAEEFIRQYLNGKIEIYGFKFPKFTNKKLKRRIDPKFLIEFILSDTPANEIDYIMGIKELPDTSESSRPMPIIDKEELDRITDVEHNINALNKMVKDSYTLDEGESSSSGAITDADSKDGKILIKNMPGLIDTMTKIRKENIALSNMQKYMYDYSFGEISAEDMRKIAAHDARYGKKAAKINKMPEFDGDIMDDKAYHKYLRDVYDYQRACTVVKSSRFNNEVMSIDEREEDELKDTLNAAGINVRALWNNMELERKENYNDKLNRMKTNQLKNILQINQDLREKKITQAEAKERKRKLKEKYKKKKAKAKRERKG